MIKEKYFFVNEKFINQINNILIAIEPSLFDNYFYVKINYPLLDRYNKIYLITKNEKLKKILDIIHICEINRYEWYDIANEKINGIVKYGF